MKRNTFKVLMVGLLAVLMMTAWTGCTKKQPERQAAETQAEEPAYVGTVDEEGKAAGSALAAIHTADALYGCPMHSEVLTDHPHARCPQCGMNLKQMPDDMLTELRASNPKGCTMCAIVLPGNAEATTCPGCGMELVEAPMAETETEEAEGGEAEEEGGP